MEVDIDGHFGDALRIKRRAAKMTQAELAVKSSFDRTYISMLERGIRKPSLEATIALATALKVDASEIVKNVVEKTNIQP